MSRNRRSRVIMAGPDAKSKGGISASIYLLNDYLSKKGLEVLLLPTTKSETDGLQVFLIFIKSILILLFELTFHKPILVHIHMASRGSFIRKSILCWLCFLFRTPYIIHLHGGGFMDFYEGLSRLGKVYLRLVFRSAAFVIALSKVWKEWIENVLHIKRIAVVPNGVQDISFQPEELNRTQPTVLFLGLLGPNKGTDILIEAMREVTKHIPSAVLELGGNGDLDRYKEQACDLQNVKFLGWINENERRAALARASIYCLPSWKEGLPFSILEAMSAGLPVISTPVGSISEAVVDGVNGYLVEPGDTDGLSKAILNLLNSPDLRRSMGDAGKIIQQSKFSYERMGASCFSIYARIAR